MIIFLLIFFNTLARKVPTKANDLQLFNVSHFPHNNYESLSAEKFIEVQGTANVGQHWIVLSNLENERGYVTIYDSKIDTISKSDISGQMYQLAYEKIKEMYQLEKLTVRIASLKHQKDGWTCGIFAMLYSLLLWYGVDPFKIGSISFDEVSFRHAVYDFMCVKITYKELLNKSTIKPLVGERQIYDFIF